MAAGIVIDAGEGRQAPAIVEEVWLHRFPESGRLQAQHSVYIDFSGMAIRRYDHIAVNRKKANNWFCALVSPLSIVSISHGLFLTLIAIVDKDPFAGQPQRSAAPPEGVELPF